MGRKMLDNDFLCELRRFFLIDPYCSSYHKAILDGDWEYVLSGLERYEQNGKPIAREVARSHAAKIRESLSMNGREQL